MRPNLWTTMTVTASAAALIAGAALAAPPPADTVIGNQAAATYEANGETFVVQSNLVETIVNEVFGLDLEASQTKNGAPGGIVFFPQTVTNNGNAEDTFTLVADTAGGTDTFALTGVEIFADADEDGVPDSLTPLAETPSVLAGESFGIVVRATLPASVTTGATSDFTLTATSTGDTNQSDVTTSTVVATTDGIVDVSKQQSLLTDNDGDGVISAGDAIQVELTYANTGVAEATNVVIEDVLPNTNLAGATIDLDYAAGSATWSLASGALNDASTGVDLTSPQGDTIDWAWDNDRTLTATLAAVPAGRSGQITFSYIITDAPEGPFENIANVTSDSQATPNPSNASPIIVLPSVDFVLADAAATGSTPPSGTDVAANLDAADASDTDSDGSLNDVVEDTSSAYPGESIAFDFVLTNRTNGTDTLDLSVANAGADAFPAGTVFDIVGTDGVTPIVGDEITLGSGASTHIQVRVILPVNAPPTAAPANLNAVFTATSQADPSVSNTSGVLFNGAILEPMVDIENLDAIGGSGTGGAGVGNVDNGGDPFNTETIDPGDTAVFPLRISVATGAPANNFDLEASTDGTFAALSLPDGWSVTFFDSAGAPITNTGVLVPTAGAAATFDYEAHITVTPDSAASIAPGQNIYFRALSPTNGASDIKLDAVIVNEVADLRLTSDTVAQSQPGGFAVFEHTLTNEGNTPITGASITPDDQDLFADEGMTPILFYDANNNGILDASDPQITDVSQIIGVDDPSTPGIDESDPGLAPGETAKLFLRVQVPNDAPVGTSGTGDVSVGTNLTTPNGTITDSDTTNNLVDHTVTVTSGDVDVVKRQALDTDCDGAGLTAFTTAQQNADPDQCVVYEITVDNVGVTPATNTVINDVTPNYTTFETCGGSCAPTLLLNGTPGAVGVTPTSGNTGPVASSTPTTGFTLSPSGRAVMTFTVRIDN
ncbi:MAG: hypothetical protein AAF253_10660 [Pseudomonadota bacterium]